MPELSAAFASVGRLVRLAGSLKDRADTVQIDQAIQSLKEIAFLPHEVRGTLDSIAKGHDISIEEARRVAQHFETIDKSMAETLQYIHPRRFHENGKLSVDDLAAISMVQYGKVSMRKAVSRFLSSYAQAKIEEHSTSKIRTEARSLVRNIDKLNKNISAVEKKLVKAKKVR